MSKRNQLILVIALIVLVLIGSITALVIINLNTAEEQEVTQEMSEEVTPTVLGPNWEPAGTTENEEATQEPEQTEAAEDTAQGPEQQEIRHDYEYFNLDGLYFISDAEHPLLKEKLEEFLSTLDLQDVTKIVVPGKVEGEGADNLEILTFWLKLDDPGLTIIKGRFYFDTDEYEFQVETDEGIVNEFNATELAPPDGIDPYADQENQGEQEEGADNA